MFITAEMPPATAPIRSDFIIVVSVKSVLGKVTAKAPKKPLEKSFYSSN